MLRGHPALGIQPARVEEHENMLKHILTRTMKIEKGENMSEITISKNEYELLVRDSERVRIIERMLLNSGYLSEDDVRGILGLPTPKEEGKSE